MTSWRQCPQLLAEMIRLSVEAWPREACGVLAGPPPLQNPTTLRVVSGENRAPDPHRGFQLDPRVLIRLAKAGRRPIAFFHSHPEAPAEMSAADHRNAVIDGAPSWPGVDHVIISVYNRQPRSLAIYTWSADARRYVLRGSP